jgi:hypothetical protein
MEGNLWRFMILRPVAWKAINKLSPAFEHVRLSEVVRVFASLLHDSWLQNNNSLGSEDFLGATKKQRFINAFENAEFRSWVVERDQLQHDTIVRVSCVACRWRAWAQGAFTQWSTDPHTHASTHNPTPSTSSSSTAAAAPDCVACDRQTSYFVFSYM